MSISETGTGLISGFQFDYGVLSDEAVKAQIDDYSRLLGTPLKDTTAKNGEVDLRELEWSDSSTTFELFYKTDGKETRGSAKLFDSALSGVTQ